MQKIQATINILFTALVSLFLLGFLGYQFIYQVSADAKVPTKSTLEGREYQQFPTVSRSSIANGQFQLSFSKYVADNAPFRNQIIIANASIQHSLIAIANYPFDFETVPTFLGSQYLYAPSEDRLSAMPLTQSDELEESLINAAETWTTLIDKNPDTLWYVYMPDRSNVSQVSPGHDLVANPADRGYWKEYFFSRLPESCTYIEGGYEDRAQWEADFFRTDHHWQVFGAFAAYQDIASQMGLTPIKDVSYFKTGAGSFWGSFSRGGLFSELDGDSIWDIYYPSSDLEVRVNGQVVSPAFLDKGLSNTDGSFEQRDQFQNKYAEWFHNDCGLIEIENKTAETNRSLLIIGDSYTNNFDRLFAENFGKVYVLDPRYYSGNVSQFVSSIQPTDALIMLSTIWNEKSVLEKIE